jgi:hypothetical protein
MCPYEQDARSPSPPYRSRAQLDSPTSPPATSGATARGPYNPNMSGMSLSPAASPPKPPLSQSAAPAYVMATTTASSDAGGAQGSSKYGGGPTSKPQASPIGGSASRGNPNLSALYTKGSVALRTAKKASEFDVRPRTTVM